MSILIKGMEMPESCYYCPFRQGSFGKFPIHRAMCMVTGEVMPVDGENMQHDQPCPLVYVPPHGRLIDADAVLRRYEYELSRTYTDDFAKGFQLGVKATVGNGTAVVIEAEEGE